MDILKDTFTMVSKIKELIYEQYAKFYIENCKIWLREIKELNHRIYHALGL